MTDSPLHIAIIPDGNRRWAKKNSLHPWDGHREAIEHFRELTQWCRNDPRVSVLTVWCFSTENWKRDKKEVDMLMNMLEEYLAKERQSFLKEKTRLVHSGRKDRIPESLATLISEVEEETLNHSLRSDGEQAADPDWFTLHLAVDYGGMDEVTRAVQKVKDKHLQENVETIRAHLDQPDLPDIDLIIRTSGEKRTSNFFLWQSAYAEWDFLEKYFPDFTEKDLAHAVENFATRTRRFGG